MKTDIKELTAKLPDYEDFMSLAEAIATESDETKKLDILIKDSEANIVKTVTTDTKYFQNGKMPSMSYVEATYKYTGLDGELVKLRLRLAEHEVQLAKLKTQMDTYKTILDIWRTLNANSRRAEL